MHERHVITPDQTMHTLHIPRSLESGMGLEPTSMVSPEPEGQTSANFKRTIFFDALMIYALLLLSFW